MTTRKKSKNNKTGEKEEEEEKKEEERADTRKLTNPDRRLQGTVFSKYSSNQ